MNTAPRRLAEHVPLHRSLSRRPTLTAALLALLCAPLAASCLAQGDGPLDDAEATGTVDEGVLKAAPVCLTLQRGVLGNVSDATLSLAAPAQNNGAGSQVDLGYGSLVARRALFRFGLEMVPVNAAVLSAKVTLDQTNTGAAIPRVHAVTSPWSEATVTQASFGSGYYGAVLASPSNALPVMTFDITALAQAWVSGTTANNGILLEQAASTETHVKSSEWAEVARRPRLDLCYQLTCAVGFADCDGDGQNGCEASLDSALHCGGCDVVCPASQICQDGACAPDPNASDAGSDGAPGSTTVLSPAHPRLWVKKADLARLRSWAVPQNPIYVELKKIADQTMIAGDLDNPATSSGDPAQKTVKQDQGSDTYQMDPTSEEYARLLAFLSLVDPDPAKRADYAKRAHDLLMGVINAAAACPLPVSNTNAVPFCSSRFALFDRASFQGDAWATVLDWAYPTFTAAEKATIQKVFLRWSDELTHAMTTSYNHPEPIGVVDSPVLTAQDKLVRWAANNYFAAHMKNLGLIALALDPTDDPPKNAALAPDALGNTVRSYLPIATGAYLYMSDYFYRYGGEQADPGGSAQDMRGLGPEGTGYGVSAMGFAAQLYLALHSAGRDDPDLFGAEVSWADHPHWGALVPALLHDVEPSQSLGMSYVGAGPFTQVSTFGEVNYESLTVDPMILLGPRGVWAYDTGRSDELNAIRFVEKNLPAGGAPLMTTRVAKTFNLRATLNAIFTFLLFDPSPSAPAITDPRPALPLVYESPGLGRISARTSHGPDSTWMTYKLSFKAIDHQLSDGNQIELYRKGQWLTKELSGYGPRVGLSSHHNTMALENDLPHDLYKGDLTSAGGITFTAYQTGSQWPLGAAGDPLIVRKSLGHEGFLHVTGDATGLYNLVQNNLTASGITHASRSMVWIQPDHLIVYDRATSKSDGRFKRFFLNTQTLATIAGGTPAVSTGSLDDIGPAGTPINRLIATVPPTGVISTALVHPVVNKVAGPSPEQQLVITTLLPSQVIIAASAREDMGNEPLAEDPMKFLLKIEAAGEPKDARFLQVIQGADAGAAPDPAVLFQIAQLDQSQSPYEGALVHGTLVLFARRLGEGFTGLSYKAPIGTKHILTGLPPSAGFDVALDAATGLVTVTPGGATLSDSGGVLTF